jgi:hypothetical protein
VNSVHPGAFPVLADLDAARLYREAPDRADDSGRRVFADAETDEDSNGHDEDEHYVYAIAP